MERLSNHHRRLCAAIIAVTALAAGADAAARVDLRAERHHGHGWTTRSRYPVFPAGSALARRANLEFRGAVRKQMDSYEKGARRHASDGPGWTFEAEPTVSLRNERVISGFFAISSYTGGAHGMSYYLPVNVGLVGGRPRVLKLAELFRRGRDPVKLASAQVMARLRKNERAESVRDGTITSLGPRQLSKWVLTPTGFTFLFDPYELASYAAGPFEVKVPYTAFAGALDPTGPLASL